MAAPHTASRTSEILVSPVAPIPRRLSDAARHGVGTADAPPPTVEVTSVVSLAKAC